MTKSSIGRMFGAAKVAGAAVGLMMYANVASGVVYSQRLDPPIYTGFGFFDLAPDCIPNDLALHFVNVTGSCSVTILDILLTGNAPPTGTVRFAGPAPSNPITNGVTDLLWNNGNLVGLDTILLTSIAQSGDFNNPGGYTLQYFTHFDSETSTYSPTADLSCGSSINFLKSYWAPVDPGLCGALSGAGGVATQEIAVVVPEPGSLALILGAFGAAWFARRKSRNS